MEYEHPHAHPIGEQCVHDLWEEFQKECLLSTAAVAMEYEHPHAHPIGERCVHDLWEEFQKECLLSPAAVEKEQEHPYAHPIGEHWIHDLWDEFQKETEVQEMEEVNEQSTPTLHDAVQHKFHFTGPDILCDMIKTSEQNQEIKIDRNDKIIDVAAGTGTVGVLMKSLGFYGEIDAIEPNENMWKVASSKNIYTKRYSTFITPDKETEIPSNTYAFMTCVGGFKSNRLTPQCLTELIRMLKVGGCLVAVMNHAFWLPYKTEIDRLVKEKTIDLVCEHFYDQYISTASGTGFILRKL